MNAIASAIYTKLTGGTALTALLSAGTAVYWTQPPDYSILPYVIFSKFAGGPQNISPSDIRSYLYFVRGYGTLASQAGSIDVQISALLHHGTLAVTGYTNFRTDRETDLENVEFLKNGQSVFMAGALYRIMLDD